MILGIDEAGRGAVLGPLVLAGVMFENKKSIFKALAAAGVRDSKLLTSQKRAELASLVFKQKNRLATEKIAPAILDKYSLNDLEAKRTARIINKLKPKAVFVDVPASGKGIERYCDKIRSACKHKAKIIGGNKMESVSLAVAAASIIAKETREKEVRKLHKIYGDFGSGYPSDPRTIKWLARFDSIRSRQARRGITKKAWPEIVRTKWKTISSL